MTDRTSSETETLRSALESIAGWRKVNIQGEYEHGLRDIIRSITDCAAAALDASTSATEKEASDAPVWYSADEASAWANGYNACSGHAPTAQQWQPIETAPKSKTILLFAVTDIDPVDGGRIRNWMMATGWWHPGYENDAKVTPWCWDGHQVPKYGVQPTHWMELPEAPTLSDTSTFRPCDGCDGHECDNGCAYPGAVAVTSPDREGAK
jgi:hypothetical protein